MNWLRRFMIGRYGADELSFALLLGNLVFWVLGAITDWWVFPILSTVCCALIVWRMLSKQIYKRQKENRAFLSFWNPIKKSVKQWYSRIKDTNHKYIRCKKCRERLRLPRGKGRIEVTCPKCRERFITKT